MHTVEECLAKAAELEKRAAECPEGEDRAEFQRLAKAWRSLAKDCAWRTVLSQGIAGNLWGDPTKH